MMKSISDHASKQSLTIKLGRKCQGDEFQETGLHDRKASQMASGHFAKYLPEKLNAHLLLHVVVKFL